MALTMMLTNNFRTTLLFFFITDYSIRLFVAFSGVIPNLSTAEMILASLAGVVADLMLFTLTSALTIIYRKKWLAICKAVIDFLLLTVVFANAASLYIARTVLSLQLLLPAFPSTLTYISSFSSIEKFLLFSGLITGIICFKWYLKKCLQLLTEQNSQSNHKLIAMFLVVSCALSFGHTTLFRGVSAGWLALSAQQSVYDLSSDYLFLNRNVKTDFSLKNTLSESDREYLKNIGLINPCKAEKLFDFKKVVIVGIEALDLAYLHSMNADIPAEATMNLDAAAGKYLSFTNYYTTVQPSLHGRHAMMTSRFDYYLDDGELPSIFSEFGRNGFTTYFISAGDSTDNMDQWIFDKRYKPDFRYFSEQLCITEKNAKRVHFGVDADCIFNKIISLLKAVKSDDKLLIQAFTIDTHPPYGCKPDDSDPAMKNEIIRNSPFLSALTHLDRHFGDFLKTIEGSGLLDDDTLIVITADHSSVMGENYTNRAEFTPDRIPLIFITKANKLAPFFDGSKPCSQIDLPVTLLSIQGFDIPKTFMGSDIRTKAPTVCTSINTLRLRIITPEWDFIDGGR